VDLNVSPTDEGHILVAVTPADWERLRHQLGGDPINGMEVLFYDEDQDELGKRDDLIVEGHLLVDVPSRHCFGVVDWQQLRHESDAPRRL